MGELNPTPVTAVKDDPKKPWKAIAGATATGVAAFVAFWIGDDDPFTKKDAGEAFLAALIASAPGFGLPFVVPNPKKLV